MDPGSIPGQGTKSHRPLQPKIEYTNCTLEVCTLDVLYYTVYNSAEHVYECNEEIVWGSSRIKASSEFPGGLLVRILGFRYHVLGSVPGCGTDILQVEQHGQINK